MIIIYRYNWCILFQLLWMCLSIYIYTYDMYPLYASKELVEDNVLFSRDAPKWRPAIPVRFTKRDLAPAPAGNHTSNNHWVFFIFCPFTQPCTSWNGTNIKRDTITTGAKAVLIKGIHIIRTLHGPSMSQSCYVGLTQKNMNTFAVSRWGFRISWNMWLGKNV